MKVGVVPHW